MPVGYTGPAHLWNKEKFSLIWRLEETGNQRFSTFITGTYIFCDYDNGQSRKQSTSAVSSARELTRNTGIPKMVFHNRTSSYEKTQLSKRNSQVWFCGKSTKDHNGSSISCGQMRLIFHWMHWIDAVNTLRCRIWAKQNPLAYT